MHVLLFYSKMYLKLFISLNIFRNQRAVGERDTKCVVCIAQQIGVYSRECGCGK